MMGLDFKHGMYFLFSLQNWSLNRTVRGMYFLFRFRIGVSIGLWDLEWARLDGCDAMFSRMSPKGRCDVFNVKENVSGC
jgi:hypothetical protein